MKIYYIGYDNKPWAKMTDFVIQAETRSPHVADFILKSYIKAAEQSGMTNPPYMIATEDQIIGFRYA